MKKKSIIINCIIVLFYSCGNKATDSGAEIIHINPNEAAEYVNLSEIADSIKLIKLQPESDDVIGRVWQIIIKKKYIYVPDATQQVIFVFDKEGKFVAKLNKQGEGPDEYQFIRAVFIDDNEEYIEVVNSGRKTTKLKYANLSFELVENAPFPDLHYNLCKRYRGMYYFSTARMDNTINSKPTNADLIVVDEQNNMKTLFDKRIETNNSYYDRSNGESFIKNDKNEFFASIMFDNSFYQLEAGEARPVFTVDFGKYGINNDVGLKSTEKQQDYLRNMTKLASFPFLNINNDDIMSFSYYFKEDINREYIHQYIKIKKDNKIYHVKQIKNDLTKFPERIYISSFLACSHETWHEDYLVDIVFPANYFYGEDDRIFVDGIGEITADDDPVIVMMKLKK